MVFQSYRKVGMFISLLFIFFLQIGLTPSEATAPSPYVYTPAYPSSITLGDYAEIYVRAKNNGGTSDDGAIVVSFPSMTDSGDKSYVYKVDSSGDSGSGYMDQAKGDPIYHKDMGSDRIPAEYLKVEWYETNWTNGEINFLKIKVKPKTTGNFYFYVRSSMGQGGTYYNYPVSSSYVDQQGWEAKRYRITVLALGDSYEPDNNSGQAKTINSGARQTRSIIPANDVDWVKFSLSNTSNVTIETSGSSGDTRMWLYNSSLSQLVYDDDGGSGYFSKITKNNLSPGTYYVKIDEYGNNNEISTYYLSLNVVSIQPPSPSVSADATSFTLGVGESSDVKFTLTNSGGISDRSYLDVILSSDSGLEANIVSYTSNWWSSGFPKKYLNGTTIWKKTDTTQGTLTNHPTAIEAYRGADWSSGSSGYIIVRIKGKSAGTHYIYYKGAMNPKGVEESNYAPDNFIRDPTSGSIEPYTRWYAKRITVTVINPSPSVEANYPSITLGVGETKDITFTLSNSGGISDYSYLDINFSDGASSDGLDVVSVVSKSSIWQIVKRHPNGDAIWCKTDTTKGTLTSHTLNYEAYKEASDWPNGASGSVTLRVKALKSGTWYIKYRGSMNPKYVSPENYSPDTYIRTPTSGETDQQGWYAKKITMLVNTAPNASMASPTNANIGLAVGESQTFTVKGTDTDGNLKGAKWYLDGTLQATHSTLSGTSGTDSWNYAFDTVGIYNVEALVFDTNDVDSNRVKWTVDVISKAEVGPVPSEEPAVEEPPIVGEVANRAHISGVQLNRIPAVVSQNSFKGESSHIEYFMGNLLINVPPENLKYLFDMGKLIANIRIANPTDSNFDGFLRISELIDPRSNSIALGNTYELPINVPLRSEKDFKIPIVPKEGEHIIPGDWLAKVILLRKSNKEKVDSKSVSFNVKQDGKAIFASPSNDIRAPYLFPEPIPYKSEVILYDILSCILALSDLDFGGGASQLISWVFNISKDRILSVIQNTATLEIENTAKNGLKTFHVYCSNRRTPPYPYVYFSFDRAIIMVDIPSELEIIDSGGAYTYTSRVPDSNQSYTMLTWLVNGVDKQIKPGWEQTFTFRINEKNISGTYKIGSALLFQIGPLQGIPGSHYENLNEIPLIYNYSKWQSTPTKAYWYVIASAWDKKSEKVNFGKYVQLTPFCNNSVSFPDRTSASILPYTFDEYTLLGVTKSPSTTALSAQAVERADEQDIIPIEGTLRVFSVVNSTAPSAQVVNPEKRVVITIPYSDNNQDGIVDGTQITERDLAMFYLRKDRRKWELVEDSQVDTERNIVAAGTKQLGKMCVAMKSSGKTVSPGKIICQYLQTQEKMILRNYVDRELKEEVVGGELKIFSVDKGLIFEKEFGDDETVTWDANNIAEGKYIFIFKSKMGKKFKTKFILDRGMK